MPDLSPDCRVCLSVAIIARDAAERLAATIDSVRSIADQIVVVDTGSQDGTAEVARSRGAEVFEHPWADDFSHSRNQAAAHCRGRWILWLDAGEVMSADDAAALREFAELHADPQSAYMLLVQAPAEAMHVAGEQVGRIRLVPHRPELRFEGRLRETLKPAIAALGLAVEGLPWRIRRSSHDQNPQVKLAKARRDLRLVELDLAERGQRPDLLVALGAALDALGDSRGAIAALTKARTVANPGSSELREAFYCLLSALDGDESRRQEQLALCAEALGAFPLDASLLCAMGGYLQGQGRLDLAARSYQAAFEHGQVDPEVWHVGEIDQIAAVCLSLAWQLQGNDDDARTILRRALERDPDSQRVRRRLIDLEIKHDRRQQALAECDRLPANLPHREALRGVVRGACLAARQCWPQALTYLQRAYAEGCRDPLCLKWLSLALVSTGASEAAEPVLREWLAVEPRSVEAAQHLSAICEQQTAAPSALGLRAHTHAPRPALAQA